MTQRRSHPSPNDEELARRAQQGCTASFDQLARRFQVPLLHFLQHRLLFEDAEDLVQETFIRAYRNLSRYQPPRRFATWLFTIAHRLAVNHQRRTRAMVDSEAINWLEADGPGPHQCFVAEESRQQVWELADKLLTRRQLTALWLRYVEEMPVKEIARVVGCTPAAVKTMLFRARKQLLPLLEEHELGFGVQGFAVEPGGVSS